MNRLLWVIERQKALKISCIPGILVKIKIKTPISVKSFFVCKFIPVYWDKKSETYVYPLDELLEVERYERVDSGVRASLVWEACEESYQKSAEHVMGGAVSRLMVRNAILRCNDEAEIPAPEQKARVKELHIHADEDHVHMQKARKQKGKRNQTVPLVTVTEGSRAVSTSWNETVHPVHFVDKDFDTKVLWTSVEGYLLKAYNMENVEAIYLHGDGGSWIRNGLRDYPAVISVMDGYHAECELKKADRMFPHRNVAWRVREALRKDDRKKALTVVGSLSDSVCDTKALDKLKEFTAYLENNWDALVRRYKGELPGSCTEGQVSHVLSERFSRNPMGWSPEGLGKLSKVRAYRINGGVKGRVIKTQPHNPTYAEYYRNYLSGKLNEKLNWSIFENPVPVFDTNSGTQRLIRMIGHAG